MGRIKTTLFVFIIFCIGFFDCTFASWEERGELISGSWGKGDLEFGMYEQEDDISYSVLESVLPYGRIVIRDSVNDRLAIYNQNGSFHKIEPKMIEQNGKSIVNPEDLALYFNDLGSSKDGNFWIKVGENDYALKTATGEVVETRTERPPELGSMSARTIGTDPKKDLSTIRFPDRTYRVITDYPVIMYIRDSRDFLFTMEHAYDANERRWYRVACYDTANNMIAELDLPKSEYKILPPEEFHSLSESIIVEYQKPIIAYNGDIYCAAVTKTKFKVFKWAWRDNPKK